MSEFDGVVPALGEALRKRGYAELTSVQRAVLEPGLESADALVSAQTGSGKTVAFGLAMAPTLLGDAKKFPRADTPLALVVAPTRELALQVKRELDWLYAETGAVIISCVGGMDIRSERRALERGAHIVVGTPGRLCDHIRRRALDTSSLKVAVLDEADEMLDLGFREDLEFILETTPEDRRTLMFSATVPPAIAKLAKNYQRDAVRVTTSEEQKQHVDIEYRVLTAAPRERENAIINVLRYYEAENALVFCNTRASVNHMVARFSNRGFQVVALSGELSQNERTHALQALRDGRARVCIATDVAARGIDLPKLELVIHADLPTNPDILLHRSGRTGRAGRKGISVLMADVKGRNRVERLLRFAKINATWAPAPSADAVNQRDEERMLDSWMLSNPLREEEQAFVENIVASHTPEQIAAAYLRLNRAGKSAPEDIQTVTADAPARRSFEERGDRGNRGDRGKGGEGKVRREEFDESIWVALSVGRKQRAEPRWLIPMLCNQGNITKRDIGTITMQAEETFVQLNADQAENFFDGLGPNQQLEKNITVRRLDQAPDMRRSSGGGAERSDGPPREKRGGDKKPKLKKKPRADAGDERPEKSASKPSSIPKGKKAAEKKPGWASKKKYRKGAGAGADTKSRAKSGKPAKPRRSK